MKIERNGVTIIVESKADLIAALQAIDELNSPQPNGDAHTRSQDENTPTSPPRKPAVRTEGFFPYLGKTIAECSRAILRENGNKPMHYHEIARQAMDGGYSSGRGTEEPEKTTPRSFEQTLRRLEDMESVGEGHFRIRE